MECGLLASLAARASASVEAIGARWFVVGGAGEGERRRDDDPGRIGFVARRRRGSTLGRPGGETAVGVEDGNREEPVMR